MAKAPTVAKPRHLAVIRAIPLSVTDDVELAEAARDGHPGAVAEVYRRFGGLVRGLLVQSIGPHAEVDDLVQETFLRFFRRAGDLREPAALRSFIVGIALRVARGELRKRRVRRFLHLVDPTEAPDSAVAGDDHEGREALRRLYAILDRLDDDSRLAFVLRHVQGLELHDVAAGLGCSLATVKRRLSKAEARVAFHARRDVTLLAYAGRGDGDVGEGGHA